MTVVDYCCGISNAIEGDLHGRRRILLSATFEDVLVNKLPDLICSVDNGPAGRHAWTMRIRRSDAVPA